MPTYEVLISDALLPQIAAEDARLPAGWRILGPADGPSGYRSKRFRVEDDDAPGWTEGKLVTPSFTSIYADDGSVAEVRVTAWDLLSEDAVRISGAVMDAEDNPGRTFTVDGPAS